MSSQRLSASGAKLVTELTATEKRDFLNSFDLVFCDCDGVIWQNLSAVIPGAPDAINYLRSIGKRVIFVTNNSISSTSEQMRKFASCNIQVEEQELIHPARTISDYLKSQNFKGLILCFSSSSFKQHLRESGFEVVEEKERLIDGSVLDLRNAIYSKDPVKAIVIDIDFNLTAWKLMRAQVHLKNPDCLFIAGAADPRVPFGGNDLLGPGAFLHIVEEANQRKAKVFGKPGIDLANLLITTYNIKDPQKVLFIGDNLKSDVHFGKICGFRTLFVLNDVFDFADMANVPNEDKPDFVVSHLSELNNLI